MLLVGEEPSPEAKRNEVRAELRKLADDPDDDLSIKSRRLLQEIDDPEQRQFVRERFKWPKRDTEQPQSPSR